MKKNMKKILYKSLAICFAVLMTVNMPISALADGLPTEIEIIENDTVALENGGAYGGEGYSDGGYTYTPPKAGKFWIKDVAGTITLAAGVSAVSFADRTVEIPEFDFYKVITQSGDVRYYRADVLKDATETRNFVYIAIYTQIGFANVLHVQYFDEAENRLYNVKATLTEEQFCFFAQKSIPHCMGEDEISQRLKTSASMYTDGCFENQNGNENSLVQNSTINNTASNPASTFSQNPTAVNNYDEYTDADGIIRSYASEYFGENRLDDGWTITDDPIVNIVPKELFFVLGQHIYVGKEYGFFLNVYADHILGGSYAVDVMVFDITHVVPSFLNGPNNRIGSTRIEPIFQYRYSAASAELVHDTDPNLSHVVIPHLYFDDAEYFLKDVKVKLTVSNPTELNPGDIGYDPYEDVGAFIINSWVNANGVGLKNRNGSFEADTIMFCLGFVPTIGTVTSIASYMVDVYNGFGNENYSATRLATENNNEINFIPNDTNNTDQIDAVGHLVKSETIELITDDEAPRLIHVGGGYVEAKIQVARKSASAYDKVRMVSSVEVTVVKDSTNQIGGTMVSYEPAEGTYEIGEYNRLNNVYLDASSQITIPANTKNNITCITPAISGIYKIWTESTQGDPYFRITNVTADTQPVIATADISTTNKNAELTIELLQGNAYYIEAFHIDTPVDYTLKMRYVLDATQVLEAETPLAVSLPDDSYIIMEFTPIGFGYHRIYTDCISGEPQVRVFSDDGTLLEVLDSGGGANAYVEYFLDMGSTYYVIVQACAEAEFTLLATSYII